MALFGVSANPTPGRPQIRRAGYCCKLGVGYAIRGASPAALYATGTTTLRLTISLIITAAPHSCDTAVDDHTLSATNLPLV